MTVIRKTWTLSVADLDAQMKASKERDAGSEQLRAEIERLTAERDEERAENERLREALFAIVCNTEPSAIKHRDYDHLANAIYVWASEALGEDK